MKTIITTLLTLIATWCCLAQDVQEPSIIDIGLTPEFIDFSLDDRYMVAEGEGWYSVWNMETQTNVLDGDYNFKLGRFVTDLSIPEGSGYFLFGHEDVFMTVDYQHNHTEMKGFSLKTGAQLWESTDLDVGVNIAESIILAHSGDLLDVEVAGARLSGAQKANNFFTKDRFLDRLIHYIPEKNAIAMTGKNGLQLVDIRNGNTLWTQSNFKGGIGEVIIDEVKNQLYVITVPLTDGALDELTTIPSVIAFQVDTGEQLWEVEYTGKFVPDYASLLGNTLVLPYLELTLIDTESGIERDGDVKSRVSSLRHVSKGLSGLVAMDKALGGNFGQSSSSSKYNRLIPRQLHFNTQGKLCYFTKFNKDGKWGTGQKKGFMVIDIHQDLIELEAYAILDNQWTVLQDDLDAGIFYVKARGNMNRTLITALDANTGKVLFETEKAKNSSDISKAFNPFMIHGDYIIDIVSKGVYVFDKKTGQKISYVSTKDLGIGTVNFSDFYENGLLLFGTKGLGVMDFKGDIVARVASKKIQDVVITPKDLLVLEAKAFKRVSMQDGQLLEDVPFKNREHIAFSRTGKILVKYHQDQVEIYKY
ncbi:PQQ-binding-like beta-propeller repeat protein [Bizionia sp.]|uniref:outer membrane protein assembly factor BamB family protein n=1 Tax=Bizionia sp. TaxID=1954480 RepID=UPI003A94A0B0